MLTLSAICSSVYCSASGSCRNQGAPAAARRRNKSTSFRHNSTKSRHSPETTRCSNARHLTTAAFRVVNLNYNHLHYFWVVASVGSIAKAARSLHVTPQTISGQLRTLEDRLGSALFERVGRKLATMFVSALSTPALAPGLTPWFPDIDGNELVVVDKRGDDAGGGGVEEDGEGGEPEGGRVEGPEVVGADDEERGDGGPAEIRGDHHPSPG